MNATAISGEKSSKSAFNCVNLPALSAAHKWVERLHSSWPVRQAKRDPCKLLSSLQIYVYKCINVYVYTCIPPRPDLL